MISIKEIIGALLSGILEFQINTLNVEEIKQKYIKAQQSLVGYLIYYAIR